MDTFDLTGMWNQFVTSPTVVWLLSDETGQRVGLGAAIGVLLIGAFVVVRFGKQIAKKCRHVPMLLLIAGGAFYAAVLALRLDPGQWAPAAAVTGLSLLVFGLGAAVWHKGRNGAPNGKKPKPA